MSLDPNDIRIFVLRTLEELATKAGIPAKEFSPECNPLEEGFMDSFALLELITALEAQFNASVNFGDLDPEALSSCNSFADAMVALTVID